MAAGALGFLLQGLGAFALGAGAGAARQKTEQTMKQQELWQNVMKTMIQAGQPIPDDLAKQAGMDPKTTTNIANFLSQSVRQRQVEQQAWATQLMGGVEPGTAATTPIPKPPGFPAGGFSGAAAPRASTPSPTLPFTGQPAGPDTQALPPELSEAVTPVALTASAPSPTMPPPGTIPPPANAPTLPPAMPQPGAPAPASAPGLLSATPSTVARARPGMSLKVGDMTFNIPAVSKDTEIAEQRRVAQERFVAYAGSANKPYDQLVREASSLGVLNDPNVQKALELQGEARFSAVVREAVKKTPPMNDADLRAIQFSAWGQTGYLPKELIGKIAPTAQEQDHLFAKTFQQAVTAAQLQPPGTGPSVESIYRAVQQSLGITPSPQALQQMMQVVNSQVRESVIRDFKGIENNPSDLENQVNRRLGGFGVSPENKKLAEQPAPIDPATAQYMARQGLPVPLQSSLQSKTSVPGADAATQHQAAAAEQTKIEADKARQVAEAGVKGREAGSRSNMVSEPKDLQKYVNPATGGSPAPATKDALDTAVREGKLGFLTVAPDQFAGLKTLRSTIARYQEIVDKKDSIFNLSPTQRAKLRKASSTVTAEIAGIRLPISIPPDVLPGLRKDFTREQIDDMNEILTLNNTVVATLRGLGEKGQGVSSKLFARGEEAFPNFLDDKVSAAGKVRAMTERARLALKEAVSYPGRQYVIGPKGEHGTVPIGTKLEPGWRIEQ